LIDLFISSNLEEDIISLIYDSYLDSKKKNICISGGNSLLNLYKKLNTNPKFLQNTFYLSDERDIDLNNTKSNFYNIRNTLFHNKNYEKNFIYFKTYLNQKDCILEYENSLKFNKSSFFDFSLIGVGEDGHIASLFDNENLISKENILYTNSKFHLYNRYTIGINFLAKSKKIFLFFYWKKKKNYF